MFLLILTRELAAPKFSYQIFINFISRIVISSIRWTFAFELLQKKYIKKFINLEIKWEKSVDENLNEIMIYEMGVIFYR